MAYWDIIGPVDEYVSPEKATEKRAKRTAGYGERYVKSLENIIRKQEQAPTDEEVAERLARDIAGGNPGISREELTERLRSAIPQALQKRDRATDDLRTNIPEIAEGGGFASPESLRLTEEQIQQKKVGDKPRPTKDQLIGHLKKHARTPDDILAIERDSLSDEQVDLARKFMAGEEPIIEEHTDSPQGYFFRAFDTLAGIGTGAYGGALKGAMEAEGDIELQEAPEERSMLQTAGEAALMGAAPAFIPFAGVPIAMSQLLPTGAARAAVTGERWESLDVQGLLGKIVKDPSIMMDIAEAAWEGAKTSTKEGTMAEPAIAQAQHKAEQRYAIAAAKMVKKEFPNITRDDAIEKTKVYLDRLKDHDIAEALIEHPDMSQFVGEVGLDPLTYASGIGMIAKPLAGIGKGSKAAKVAAKVGEYAPEARTAFGSAVLGGMGGAVMGAGDIGAAAGAIAGPVLKKAAPAIFKEAMEVPKLRKAAKLMSHSARYVQTKGQKLRDALFAGEDRGIAASRKFIRDAEKDVASLDKVKKADEKVFRGLIEDEISIPESYMSKLNEGKMPRMLAEEISEKVPEHLKEPFMAQLRLRALDWRIKKEYGLGKAFTRKVMSRDEQAFRGLIEDLDISDEIKERIIKGAGKQQELLEDVGYLDKYMPHQQFADSELAKQYTSGQLAEGIKDVRGNLIAKTSNKRHLPAKFFSDNVADNWRLSLKETSAKLKSVHEINYIHNALHKKGWKVSMAKTLKDEDVFAKIKELDEVTGMKWVSLDRDIAAQADGLAVGRGEAGLGDTWRRITGKPGQVMKGRGETIVPLDVAERLEAMLPILNNQKQAFQSYNRFMNKHIRPIQKIWRMTHTITMPAFSVMNAVSGGMYGALGLGIKAADPKMQGAAAAGAVFGTLGGSPRAKKMMRGIEVGLNDGVKAVKMNGGKKITLEDAWKKFEEVGLGGQLEARTALDVGEHIPQFAKRVKGQGKLARTRRVAAYVGDIESKLVGGAEGVLEKALTPMKYPAQMTENYQHFVTFLGFLDNLSDEAVDKALRLSSEYSANYNRLSAIEKNVLRDAFGFYSWTKFAGVHLVKQIAKNPERIATFIKMRGLYGDDPSVDWRSLSPWLRDKAVKAKFTGKGLSDDQYAAMIAEDPVNAGLASLESFIPFMGDKYDESSVSDSFANVLTAITEMSTGMNIRTGQPIKGWTPRLDYMLSRMADKDMDAVVEELKHNHLSKFAYGFIERPSDAFLNIVNLHMDNGRLDLASSAWMRYKAERDFSGLQRILAYTVGKDPSRYGVAGGGLGMLGRQYVGSLAGGTRKQIGAAQGDLVRRLKREEKKSR